MIGGKSNHLVMVMGDPKPLALKPRPNVVQDFLRLGDVSLVVKYHDQNDFVCYMTLVEPAGPVSQAYNMSTFSKLNDVWGLSGSMYPMGFGDTVELAMSRLEFTLVHTRSHWGEVFEGLERIRVACGIGASK